MCIRDSTDTATGKLTTHVLDTSRGCPGAGLRIQLHRLHDGQKTLLKETTTNSDGRCDGPLLQGDKFESGNYELLFFAGDYFRGKGGDLKEPLFIDNVVIQFGIANASEHYHVPLLVSPFSYSTYRGS